MSIDGEYLYESFERFFSNQEHHQKRIEHILKQWELEDDKNDRLE